MDIKLLIRVWFLSVVVLRTINSQYSTPLPMPSAAPVAMFTASHLPSSRRAKISDPIYRRKMALEIGPDGRYVIRMAVIAPLENTRPFSIAKSSYAIEYAMKSPMVVQLLKLCNVSVIHYADSNCDAVSAPIHAFNLYWDKKIHALIGPSCDYSLAPVARYAPYWNLPVITPGGMAYVFGEDKTDGDAEFPLLVRVGATFDGLARVIHQVVTRIYAWNKIKILYSLNGFSDVTERFCRNAMNAVVKEFRVNDDEFHFHKLDPIEDGDDSYDSMLKEEIGHEYASKKHHVTVFFVLCPPQITNSFR